MWILVGLTVLVGLPTLWGCEQPAARARVAHRQRSLQWTAQALAEREASAGERLGRTADAIQRKADQDARRSSQNLWMIEAYMRQDLRRWEERQGLYAEELGKLLAGRPENIPQAVLIWY